ncbi:MAG: hypothetical protein KGS61_18365, partial [Verrucomicrobia bacterium]|nr:hypothetical protein [Verrucomicrobiota bacterium]
MDENGPIQTEPRSSRPETPTVSRGVSSEASGTRSSEDRQAPHANPKHLKIEVRLAPPNFQPNEAPTPVAEPAPPLPGPAAESIQNPKTEIRNETIPARMLNEFVYCPRLFYYEFVEGVFVESADTLRGGALHQRVDSGSGAMPRAKGSESPVPAGDSPGGSASTKRKSDKTDEVSGETPDTARETRALPETIHSRSVQMGSERLGVVAKMDLV